MRFGGAPARAKAQAAQRANALADYVAEHDCQIRVAGAALGIPDDSCTRVWKRIKQGLGPQAR